MKTLPLLGGILIGLGAAAAAWFFLLNPSRKIVVEVIHPEYGTAVEAVYATGTVEPTIMLPIAPRISGRLVDLAADEGHLVARGQVLARLEDEDLKKELEELRAREIFASKDFERKTALAKKGYETKDSVDQAQSELDSIRASIARVEVEVSYMQMIAPAEGQIIRRDGEIGQVIPANQPVFWMSCCSPLRVSAEVDEEDIARVLPGQEVLIHADAFPEKVFTGRVQAITPKGDPVSRSYRVRISLEEATPLRIGMTAESNIVISKKDNALLLPNSAIGQNAVWTVSDGKLVKKPVTIGVRGAERTEILSGLTQADEVALAPDTDFIEGRAARAR